MAHEPPSHSFTAPKKSMRPKPTMQSTTPRRMSDLCRIVGVGGASNAGGIGWPFSGIKRMMDRTIRMMGEKGQPIPPALLAPPTPTIRQRSDMRRGVVLCMVGLGLMLFFGAVNEWEGGSWAIGVIPFVIGLEPPSHSFTAPKKSMR